MNGVRIIARSATFWLVSISLLRRKIREKTNIIDIIRLPEIGVVFVGVIAGILAVTGGVMRAVIKIIEPIRKHKITGESHAKALDTDESQRNLTKHARQDTNGNI